MEEKDLQELLKFKDFKFRGRNKGGIDCFGFFLECCKRMGMDVPDYVYTEQNAAKLLLREYHKYFERVDSPLVGDAILFHSEIIHIGIYLGNGQFVHFRKEDGARVDYLYHGPRFGQVRGFFHYIGSNAQGSV